jgi:hypothetical protein
MSRAKEKIYTCQTPGCGAKMKVAPGRGRYRAYCDACIIIRTRESNARYRAGVRAQPKEPELLGDEEAVFYNYTPKPRKLLLTDDQQKAIDRKALASYDKIRHIPLEEIAGFLFRQSAWMFRP